MILSTDELTGTTRAQPNPPTMNYLRLILGNEIDDNDLAPQIFDSYENALRSLETDEHEPIGETNVTSEEQNQ
jgi:hypothetical protein